MLSKGEKQDKRKSRHLRIRVKVEGTTDRPRLSVYRSNRNIYVQIIDDISGKTLCSASTMDKALRKELADLDKVDMAKVVGKNIAEAGRGQGIRRVVFDRSGYKFHGRVKALAESARDNGLLF